MATMEIQCRLYRAEQVRELDRRAIEVHRIPGRELMQRAGSAAWSALRALWPQARSLTVCCGGGNNAGDGYVIAALARDAGLNVQVIALKDPADLAGDAGLAASDFLAAGGKVSGPDARRIGDVIVDALLGTGLDRPVRDDHARLIERMNGSGQPILAVDIPSGLNADTGMPMGACVRADATVSFIGNKRGLYTGRAGDFVGQRIFEELQVPREAHRDLVPDARLMGRPDIGELPSRPASTHKGSCGRLLLAGGNEGMAGAVLLAARAGLRAGAGLVYVATRKSHAKALVAALPEAMWHSVEDPAELTELADSCDVIALGPGLGRGEWSRQIFDGLVMQSPGLVLDADGLGLLAESRLVRDNWVITPHPGEAARLLDTDVSGVQSDRFEAARTLAERFNAVCVLKGHGSLVAAPSGKVQVCPFGNPAMATAGMGDGLTGIIAALMGQGLDVYPAACLGVLIHGLAGDQAAVNRRQILATDLIEMLPEVMAGP